GHRREPRRTLRAPGAPSPRRQSRRPRRRTESARGRRPADPARWCRHRRRARGSCPASGRHGSTSSTLPTSGGPLECRNPRLSASREPGRTTSRTSRSRSRTIGSPWSPASPARENRRWPSTRCSPRASGATSSRSRRTRGCSSSASIGPTWTASSRSALRWRSSRRIPCAPRPPARAPPPVTLATSELDVVLDRVVLAADGRARLVDSLETALREGGGRVAVEVVGGPRRAFTEEFRCGGCGAALERPQPLLFSFNHPLGACAECKGFGNVLKYDESLVVPDRALSLGGGAIEPWTHPSGKWYQRELVKAARRAGVDLEVPWERLGERERALVYGGDGKFPGINGFFEEIASYRHELHVRVFLSRYRTQSPCPVCAGARLKPAALAVKVAELTIAEFTGLTIERAAATLDSLSLTAWEAAVGREILRQLSAKLTFLLRVGLG